MLTLLGSKQKNPVWHVEYFKLLVKSHFFLAASGIYMPQSHNVIEAMAAGCIPLIEYGEWFTPGLTHLENCIAFKGEHDLVEKVKLILSFSKKEIEKLRIGVLDYYKNNLTADAVVNQITSGNYSQILLNAEDYSVELMKRK